MNPEQRAEVLLLIQLLQVMYGARALPVTPQAPAEPRERS